VSGGRRVDDHQVPPRLSAGLAPGLVQDLSQHEGLGERGDGAQEEANHPVLEDRLVDGPHLHDHERVLLERVARVDVDGGDVGKDLANHRAGWPAAQHGRHALPRVDLGDENPLPATSSQRGEGGGDRGFPDAPLASDDDEAAIEQIGAGHGA